MAYLDNIRTFTRIYELGSMSAAARDQRISAAVASARIAQLEEHLGVRLFLRTTRSLSPTEHGQIFYEGAQDILATVERAEAAVDDTTENPRGTLHIAAPLGLGRRLIAPQIPRFCEAYPLINIRLRLSDRKVDIATEGLDLAFILGRPEDSSLRIRNIADCPRVLCASPGYIARAGHPTEGHEIEGGRHSCLNLRFPGATEFQWMLSTSEGPRRFDVRGRLESDDGDVLTDWALADQGIIMKPLIEVAPYLESGALVQVCEKTPPLPVQLACLFVHRRHQDPKTRLFIDFLVEAIQRSFGKDGTSRAITIPSRSTGQAPATSR